MIRVSITIPLASIPGVEVEAEYDHAYRSVEVDGVAPENFALVLTGELLPDYDYEEAQDYARTRPHEILGQVKLTKPRLIQAAS